MLFLKAKGKCQARFQLVFLIRRKRKPAQDLILQDATVASFISILHISWLFEADIPARLISGIHRESLGNHSCLAEVEHDECSELDKAREGCVSF